MKVRLFVGLMLFGAPVAWAKVGSPTAPEAKKEIPAWVAEIEEATPTEAKKLEIGKEDADARAKWKKWVDDYAALPADQIRANPAAAAFPGLVKEGTPRGNDARFDVDMNMPRWQFTGFYAAPGEKVTIKIPAAAKGKELKVRIGCHTDSIFRHDKWSRFPSISRGKALTEEVTEIANPFGGLVYIEVPRDKDRGGVNMPTYGGYIWLDEKVTSARPASYEIRISGIVKAPVYRLGKTSAADWKAQLASTGAPWGEMAGKRFVFSLPVDILRGVKDPEGVLKYWDRVLDECWKFGGWRGERTVPERFVPDVQISAGYLHSGYPFMGHFLHAKEVVDFETLKTKGNWGFFHELGHNHEGQAYTFGSDYVEVVVNLHTLYLMKVMCGLSPEQARPGWDPAAELKKAAGGSKDAFALLAMYVPLIETFGFESLTKTFQTYWVKDGMKGVGERPFKIDEFVSRYSTTVGRNCADYFAKFDLKCTDATAKRLSSLPRFMPAVLEAEGEGKKP